MGLIVILALAVIVGSICGIIAVARQREFKRRLDQLERRLAGPFPESQKAPRAVQEERITAAVESEKAAPPKTPESLLTAPPRPFVQTPERPAPLGQLTQKARDEWSSLERTIGSKWLNWVGVVLVTIGVAYFLKYMYDNQWIGPVGRLAIGTMAGVAALVIGEKSRRAGYSILFHALTGGGFGAFYVCIFFSFQVYHLTGQTVSFVLAIFVTGLAVAMSVVHNARVICLLGQIGGFLSPILISTGENHPVPLFSFIAILNLATMGCAFYKNWRDVNVLAFAGTWLLYGGWYAKFYDSTQLGIALFSSSLFYLMFLIIPTARGFVKRERLTAQNLQLVAGNIIVVFINNALLLYSDYRSWLGFAVIVQALTLLAMYAYWMRRIEQDSNTRATLLVAALALVTVAIPIQLRFYAVPIGWAMEAFVLGYIGQRYQHRTFQIAALAAIFLASAGLVVRLPLHRELFTPIFNRPFGSWLTVIAFTFSLGALFRRHQGRLDSFLKQSPLVILGLGVVLLCALIHMEIADFWTVRRGLWGPYAATSHRYTSLTFLWSIIPLIFLWLGRKGLVRFSVPAALSGYGIGTLVILEGAVQSAWIAFDLPFLNVQWLSRLAFAAALWLGANWMHSVPDRPSRWKGWMATLNITETVGHILLVFLLRTEVDAWMSASRIFSSSMRFGFTSTLWSLYALALVAIGLRTRNQFRRILGFVLFGITVGKILLIDMAVLQPVYRILSFVTSGVLLIIAAYLYQKFAKALLEPDPAHAEPQEGGAS